RMMNIDGIGEETCEALFASGLVNNIADLYTLTREKLMTLEGFGEKSADRILQSLEQSKNVPFERVIYALSIPFVGETVAKKIARACRSMERLRVMSAEELTAIEDIGPRIAESIREYMDAPINQEILERLAASGLRMAAEESAGTEMSDKLSGRSFVISGVFVHHSRDDYKAMIEANGGKNVGSISKKTDFVLAGANMGPAKLEKATNLGIPVIDEDTFLAMIN
ncbi:MAG: NAD-dependent DNA ligase LigA, partial [Paramuribaculum sp.]|nr:NAD-dependent DNA ligase LigA [Paramuribaculum sp.]